MLRRSLALAFALALVACEAGGRDAEAGPDPATATEGTAVASPTPSPTASPAPSPPDPAPTRGEADAAACGADKLDRWLNVLPTEDVKAEIAAAVGDRPIRYYGPNDAITMDFSPRRLNGELGEDGRIKRFRCG